MQRWMNAKITSQSVHFQQKIKMLSIHCGDTITHTTQDSLCFLSVWKVLLFSQSWSTCQIKCRKLLVRINPESTLNYGLLLSTVLRKSFIILVCSEVFWQQKMSSALVNKSKAFRPPNCLQESSFYHGDWDLKEWNRFWKINKHENLVGRDFSQ